VIPVVGWVIGAISIIQGTSGITGLWTCSGQKNTIIALLEYFLNMLKKI